MKSILTFIALFLAITAAWAQYEPQYDLSEPWYPGEGTGGEMGILPVGEVGALPIPEPDQPVTIQPAQPEQPVTIQPVRPAPAPLYYRSCLLINNTTDANVMCPKVCNMLHRRVWTGHAMYFPNSACQCR